MHELVRNTWIIAKREFIAYFSTPLATVFLIIFIALTGAFAFYVGGFFERGQADLAPFFQYHPWLYLLLVPAVAILSTLCVVAVSGKSTTIQGAQGVAGLIVLPIIALVVGQAAGVVLFDVIVVVIASAVVIVADAVLLRVVSGNLSRERLVTQL